MHAPIQLKVHIISLVTMLAFYIWHWCTNCSNRQLTHKLLKLSITIHQAFSCCKTVQICHLNSTSENYIIPEISCVCTVPTKSHGTLARLPIESYSKQVCNLECCGNKMHPIVANMTVSKYLLVILSLLWSTTISGCLPSFIIVVIITWPAKLAFLC